MSGKKYHALRFFWFFQYSFLDNRRIVENESMIYLGVGNGAVFQSLRHVGIYCASIVLLWIVKNALILVVTIYMRCKLLIP